LLKSISDEPVTKDVHDRFFDRVDWDPSVQTAATLGVESALGVAVIFDSRVHRSWDKMRELTTKRYGQASEIGEKEWIDHYVAVRQEWLSNHSIPPVRKTVYRM